MLRKNKNQSAGRKPIEQQRNAAVFSYYAGRSASDAAKGRAEVPAARSIKWQLLPSYIALLAIIFSLMYAAGLDTNPRVRKPSGAASVLLRSEETYQAATRELLRSSILNRSKLSVDTKKVERQLLERFPELQSASITVPLTSRRPILALEAVKPKLIMQSQGVAYVLDARGKAVMPLEENKSVGELGLWAFQDESGLEVKIGQSAIAVQETEFISEVGHQLKKAGLVIESITLPATPNELLVRLKGEPYFVTFNMQGDSRLQSGALLAVKGRLERERIRPAEYIDVRIEDKVFYK